MQLNCDACVTNLAVMLERILSEHDNSIDVNIVNCIVEETLKALFKDKYGRLDRLLVPDAAALLEIKAYNKPPLKILVVVEHGGKSSIHDIQQGLETYEEIASLLNASQIHFYVITYHLAGRMLKMSTRIHSQKRLRRKPIRVVLTSGCCTFTKQTVHGKLAKPVREMLI